MSVGFQPVNKLEEIMVAAAEDPASRAAFYRALTEHDLFVISAGPPEGSESMQIRMIEIQGNLYAAVFTSVERISAMTDVEVSFVGMNGRAMLTMLRDKEVALNLGSDVGKILTALEIESILDGSIFAASDQRYAAGTAIQLGQPAVHPARLTDALARLYGQSKQVQAAYLAQIFVPDVDECPHLLVGVEVTDDFRRVAEDSGVVVRDVLPPGESVDFVEVKSGAADGVGRYLLQTAPFYKREKKWLGLF